MPPPSSYTHVTTYRVAIVGVGADPTTKTKDGFAMGYAHAEAYRQLDACEIVACADLKEANARRFAEQFDLDSDRVFTDHERLLAAMEPNIVSVCVPAPAHAEIVQSCLRSDVDAIHCEKPMAATWRECRTIALESHRRDVQLTFNHQRRFNEISERTKELVDSGAIGELTRIETNPFNLFDYGSHSLDLASYYTGDQPAAWVLAGLDYRTDQQWFGMHVENQSVTAWEFTNGVFGIATTDSGDLDRRLGDWHHRLVGEEGILESGYGIYGETEQPAIRLCQDSGWTPIHCEEGPYSDRDQDRIIAHIVSVLGTDTEPRVSARRALNGTEIIFGAYESVRRRGRVECPLTIDDHPLEAMVADNTLVPTPE